MSEGNAGFDSVSEYTQHGGIPMRVEDGFAYPDFDFESNPGMSEPIDSLSFPIGEVPKGDGVEYAFEGEPELYPEMNFRKEANELSDSRSIPNTTYLTHGIHKHPAIFIPHIPSYLIRQFTQSRNSDGERPTVLDPFSGSGTTGLEAKINGRNYVGIEINPLSRLVSEVSTTPIPPSALEYAREKFIDRLDSLEETKYEEYDVEFLDRTGKDHWFQQKAIEGLTRIRKVTDELSFDDSEIRKELTDFERRVVDDLQLSHEELARRINRWLVLMVANTVFEVSNADPGVSKAYKSSKMRTKIDEGTHPPDLHETHKQQLDESIGQLTQLWNEIYDTDFTEGVRQATLTEMEPSKKNGDETTSLEKNDAHRAEVDIRLGDARTFELPEYQEEIDIAITSPPYINAMNYYRGSKLRLFWIYDLLEEDEKFDATELRKSIVGTNSVSMSKVDRDLPVTVRDVWKGTEEEYEQTRLPKLDQDIEAIHELDHNSAKKKGYVTWKFFAEDMAQNLARVYEHLKPGGYYFFVIGENTIGERLIHSHKYVADIARNLGKIEGHGGQFDEDDGFRLIGSAWDQITNRDLFQGRNHEGGVIECEWVVMLQKPK